MATLDSPTTTTTQAPPAVAHVPGGGTSSAGAGPRVLEHYLSTHSGAPDPGSVATIVEKFPADRDDMFRMLHSHIGNNFVQHVVTEMRAHGDKSAVDPVPNAPNHVAHQHNNATPTTSVAAAPHPAQAATPAAEPTPAPAPQATVSAAPAPATAAPAAKPSLMHRVGSDAKGAALGAIDIAEIIGELALAGLSCSIRDGTAEGWLDIGKVAHYAQKVVSNEYLQMITLESAGRGSNPAYVKINLYHRTLDLTAPVLKIAGFHSPTFTAAECELHGVKAFGSWSGSAEVKFDSGDFHNVAFIRGKDHVVANELKLTGMDVSGAAGTANITGAMVFTDAKVIGLQYPNVPAINLELGGGNSFSGVWERSQPAPQIAHGQAAGHAPGDAAAPTGGLPAIDPVLPQGAHIDVTFDGTHATAVEQGGEGSFKRLYAAMKQGDKVLASIEIDGFFAVGSVSGASGGASIQQVTIVGDPSLVQTLLQNPELAKRQNVKDAIKLVTSVGLTPNASGTIIAHNISAGAGPGIESGHADIEGHFDVPSFGVFDIKVTNLVGASDQVGKLDAMNSTFDKLTMKLSDHTGHQIAALELENTNVAVNGAARHARVGLLAAHGNVAQLVNAGSAIVDHMPTAVRGALKAVRELGITGEIAGKLDINTKVDKNGKPETEFSGDFDADLDAGNTGSVHLKLKNFQGGDQGDVKFGQFSARLVDHAGKQAASLAITNGSSPAVGPNGKPKFHADKIDAQGEDAGLSSLLGTLKKQAASLPAAVQSSFAFVERYYAQAGGQLTLGNVNLATDKAGNTAATAQNVHASFELDGAAKANITMTGFRTVVGAKTNEVQFTSFDALLYDAKGTQVAHVVIDGSTDSFAAKGDDFTVAAKKLMVDGDTHAVARLFTGVRQHIADLPPPIAVAFEMIQHYGSKISANGTVEASDFDLSSKGGKIAGSGDLAVDVHIPQGALHADLIGAKSDGDNVGFASLAVSIKDANGGIAASLNATGAHADVKGESAGIDHVHVLGDVTKLQALLDPKVQKLMPPALSAALAMLKQSDLQADLSSLQMAAAPGGGYTADAATLNVTGTLHLNDGAGHVYTAQNANLELDGAHLTLGADKKPRAVSATSMLIRGQFTSDGGGTALQGNGTVRTGAAHVTLDDNGKPISADAANMFAVGDGSRTTGVGTPSAAAATTAAATGTGMSATSAVPRPNAAALAHHDQLTSEIEDGVQAVSDADIHTSTPLVPGLYGRGLLHASIPANATVNLNIQVRHNAFTGATNLRITPPLKGPAWLTGKGADLETKGSDAIVRLRVGGLFHLLDLNLDKYIVGKGKPLSLNVAAAVQEVMDRVRAGMPAEEAESASAGDQATASSAPTPSKADLKAEKDANADKAWLDKKHADWERDVAKHERQDANRSAADRQKDEDKDAGAEPKSASFTDMFTQAIEYGKTSGSADLTIAKADNEATVTGNLHGQTDGAGTIELRSDHLDAKVGNNDVAVTGADTGNVDITSAGNTTHVALSGLKIDALSWATTAKP